MVKVFFLLVFPIMTIVFFFIYIYVLLYWSQMNFQKNLYKSLYQTRSANKKFDYFLLFFFKFLLGSLCLLLYFLCYVLNIHDICFSLFYINNLIMYQIFLFLAFVILICFTFIISPQFLLGKTLDVGFFFFCIVFFGILLLITNNLLILFINLEIFNLLIIYSFFISSYFTIYSKKNIKFQLNWVVLSAAYQFILNFFSSIAFYLIFNIILINFGTTNFLNLNFFYDTGINAFNLYIFLLFFCIFIKFGIGPWIFFKIEIYQGYNLFLLKMYSIIYFLLILVFFFNLFIIYGANLNFFYISLFFLFMFIVTCFFLFNIFYYFNIYVFFSFSSLLNLILLLIQWAILLLIVGMFE